MPQDEHPDVAYKILTSAQWIQFETDGIFHGAPVDDVDGFIHLSTADQLQGTLDKHFSGQSDLVIATIDLTAVAADLKWELSRGDAWFPHIYGTLPITAVTDIKTH